MQQTHLKKDILQHNLLFFQKKLLANVDLQIWECLKSIFYVIFGLDPAMFVQQTRLEI